jgi:hypothetical protein
MHIRVLVYNRTGMARLENTFFSSNIAAGTNEQFKMEYD